MTPDQMLDQLRIEYEQMSQIIMAFAAENESLRKTLEQAIKDRNIAWAKLNLCPHGYANWDECSVCCH